MESSPAITIIISGSGLPENTWPPFAAILASVDCHSVSGLILAKAATSLTSASIFVASGVPPSQLNNFRPSNDTLMVIAPSAFTFVSTFGDQGKSYGNG